MFAVLLAAFIPALAAEEIRAPFGFQWGESSERLESLLGQVKAKVEEREEDGRSLRLRVTGISQRMLLQAFFLFENNALVEVELHYGDREWDSAQYTRFFDQTRRHLDQKYGPGKLVARTKSSVSGVTHSLMGYEWVQPGASLQLFLFTAEKGAEVVRNLSLHYRGG